MNFRNDILMLRGYAIIVIVLYHCNILVHGYYGVIMFIVISGYLSKPYIQCINLWKRYIRLIYPSLTNIFLLLILYNKELQETQFYNMYKELFSTIFLYSNYYFIYSSTDYFNPPDNSLLLHYWYLSVDIHLHLLSAILFNDSRVIFISISISSSLVYIYTFNYYKEYNYFSSVPRIWQYLFPKLYTYNISIIKFKYIAFAVLMSILFDSKGFIDESLYHLIIAIATYLFLCNKREIRCYILEKIGIISYYIYLIHYPVYKLEGLNITCIITILLLSLLLFVIYRENAYARIINHKLIFIILLIAEIYGFMFYTSTFIVFEENNKKKSNIYLIKKINRNSYCCYRSLTAYDNKSVLFIGDSHVFNLIGNYYHIFTEYQYIIYYKYIHTEFIVRNNSHLYDITDYFNIIVNMNLFYDNKHKEYLKFYPIKVISYLHYLKSKSRYVMYFVPTPVLKKSISCKMQKMYVARNEVDILIYPAIINNVTDIILFDITHLFCRNSSCNLNYKGSCIYSDEHHFTFSFYKRILNFSVKLIKPYLNYIKIKENKNRLCEYTLYKNKILRAWKFPPKGCELNLYF